MPFRTCAHIKEDGRFCQSPALRNHRFCYFHIDPAARRLRMAWVRARHVLRLAREREADRSDAIRLLELAK